MEGGQFLSHPGWVVQAGSTPLPPDVLMKKDAQAAAQGAAAPCSAPKAGTENGSSSPGSQEVFPKAQLVTWVPDSSSARRPRPTQAAAS